MKAELFLHPSDWVGKVDPRIFDSFVEHPGRMVCGGLYEPEHPCADEGDFRTDVRSRQSTLGM